MDSKEGTAPTMNRSFLFRKNRHREEGRGERDKLSCIRPLWIPTRMQGYRSDWLRDESLM